ncbi:MAG TPA: cell division protein SepF [Actinomycetota bacterium]|nr:cell division protein SepF [Actinomycetota bacterium]
MAGLWKKTLVYLGLMEEDEELEEITPQAPERREEPTRMVRTLGRDEQPSNHPAGRGVVRQLTTSASPRQVHVVEPRVYDDAQEFGDRFKAGVPVIINLRSTEPRHAPKILHFASGLVYGLNGRMQKVADSVFLITPVNVEVSADEKRRLAEHGFFGEA